MAHPVGGNDFLTHPSSYFMTAPLAQSHFLKGPLPLIQQHVFRFLANKIAEFQHGKEQKSKTAQ